MVIMYITRFLEKEITKYLEKKEIIAITGARQCGKTTLLKHIYSKLAGANFIDFEDREKLELFETDIDGFIELHVRGAKYLFIDEFQYAKQGGKNLKYIYDSHPTKIFISGSSTSELSIHSIKYLVGRIFVFNLYPFSFLEYLSFREPDIFKKIYFNDKLSVPVSRKINRRLDEYLVYGGYPRVILSDDEEEKQTVLKNIYNTYFLKEIKEILGLKQDYRLSKLITALALQTGNIINYNELSSISGFKYKELMDYLNVLDKTFVTLTFKPFFTNRRVELVKAPKIFFLDNGFRNIAIKNFQPLAARTDHGSLRENFVASEIGKKENDLNFWRSKSKAEVDFIIQHAGERVPLEIKSKLTLPKVTRSFASFINKYKPDHGYIASEDLFENKKISDTEVHWIPLYKVPAVLS